MIGLRHLKYKLTPIPIFFTVINKLINDSKKTKKNIKFITLFIQQKLSDSYETDAVTRLYGVIRYDTVDTY